MILINNEKIIIDDIISQFSFNGFEIDILYMMYESNEVYRYDSIDQLLFEIKLRKEIVDTSRMLHRSGMKFKVFRKSECNPKYWNRTDEGGFVLRDDVKPSDAVNDIFINGNKYGTECATAMIIVYYKALLNTFPEDAFNSLFSEIHLMNWHYLDVLLREAGIMRDTQDFIPGDRLYFMNPDVDPKTPYFRGENVIDLGNGLYYGHGIGIANKKVIIRELNNYRKKDAEESAYLLNSAGRPNFKKLAYVYDQNV